jgi:methyl halide transferase
VSKPPPTRSPPIQASAAPASAIQAPATHTSTIQMPATQAIDWEERFREGTTRWERPALHPAFVDWQESGVLAPCRILVPGAGRSTEPQALAEAGFNVTVVDAAPTAVATQRARLERVHMTSAVELADLFAWQPPEPFDAVYDQACLCALPPKLWPDYVARLHGWLRPGGQLFILFMQTGKPDGPPFHCDVAAMRTLFGAARWDWPDTLSAIMSHPSGVGAEQPAVLRRR